MFAVTVLPFNTLIVILFKGEVRQKKKKKFYHDLLTLMLPQSYCW